jgi:hypothetical protein
MSNSTKGIILGLGLAVLSFTSGIADSFIPIKTLSDIIGSYFTLYLSLFGFILVDPFFMVLSVFLFFILNGVVGYLIGKRIDSNIQKNSLGVSSEMNLFQFIRKYKLIIFLGIFLFYFNPLISLIESFVNPVYVCRGGMRDCVISYSDAQTALKSNLIYLPIIFMALSLFLRWLCSFETFQKTLNTLNNFVYKYKWHILVLLLLFFGFKLHQFLDYFSGSRHIREMAY